MREGLEGAFQYFEQPGDDKKKGGSWESKLWMFADAVFSIVGWLIFGSAWQGVRSGCPLLKILVVLLLCLVAHHVWAICWPVISLCTAVILGVIWVARAVVKKLGTLIYWAQRAAGGVPEATGAEFIGPGTGRIPETSDLRTFKKTVTQDKWVLVKREGHVAVFKLGSENQTIRTAGVYVSVEPDTLRGDSAIVDAGDMIVSIFVDISIVQRRDSISRDTVCPRISTRRSSNSARLSLRPRRRAEPSGLGYGRRSAVPRFLG